MPRTPGAGTTMASWATAPPTSGARRGNWDGQLGDGTTTNQSAPEQVGTDTHWASASAGGNFTVAGKTDGTLWAWGFNVFGELGVGDTAGRGVPVQVGTDTHWASVSA